VDRGMEYHKKSEMGKKGKEDQERREKGEEEKHK